MQQNEKKKQNQSPKFWRPTTEYRNWEKQVRKICKTNTCSLSVGTEQDSIIIHHLFSACYLNAKNKQGVTLCFDPLNGIILSKVIHKQFHLDYGYGHNTIQQFLNFLEINFISKIIENQFAANKIQTVSFGGSETILINYYPNQVLVVKKDLIEIEKKLSVYF